MRIKIIFGNGWTYFIFFYFTFIHAHKYIKKTAVTLPIHYCKNTLYIPNLKKKVKLSIIKQ